MKTRFGVCSYVIQDVLRCIRSLIVVSIGLITTASCSPRPTVLPNVKPTKSAPTSRPESHGIQFEEIAARAGIQYRWSTQPRPMRNLEAFGAGCAFLDYDNDGWQDILLVGPDHIALYRNKRNGQFEDVSQPAGLSSLKGFWTGCAVGDVDGDGYPDILLTGFRRLALLKNHSGQRFEDITVQAGLDPHNRNHWGSSAGFMDLDGSGKLDLVLANYVVFGPHEPQYCEFKPGLKSGCPPASYRPEYAELWKNIGNARFRDVTKAAGLGPTHGKGLVVAFADIDNRDRIDFYLGNDGTPSDLMYNVGNLRFKNIGSASGLAFGAVNHAQAAMGADWADYDRDGRLDLIVTAFADETYSLYHNKGGRLFDLVSDQTGLSGATLKPLGFGAKWIDFDNDGWPDIVFANGHVYDNVSLIDPLSTFRQPLMLFRNEKGREFHDLVPILGGDVAKPILGRGLAAGDFDNDGRIDFLAVDYEGAPVLFHNISRTDNHWITLDVRSHGANPLSYGAKVTARAGSQVWVGIVSPASSYLSSSDPRVHFGLGPVTMLDNLTVRWADGHVETRRAVKSDQFLTILRQ